MTTTPSPHREAPDAQKRRQGLSRIGQDGAIGCPVEQLQARLGFQFLHRVGDRRLGPTQGSGRRREASLLNHSQEDPQLID